MKNSICIILLVVLSPSAWSQLQLADTFSAGVYAGATGSFSRGSFIDYHKSFYNVKEPHTAISGSIDPIYFFSLGTTLYYAPFFKEEGPLSNLGLCVGLGFVKTGFRSHYSAEYTDPNVALVDKSTYSETYRITYLTIPVTVRYGKKWFAEVGLATNQLLYASRSRHLERAVTGADAYQGGYTSESKNEQSISDSLVNKSVSSFILAVGCRVFRMGYLRLGAAFSGKLLTDDALNFKTVTPELQFVWPLYRTSFF